MSVSKDPARGTYYVQCWYKDWTGRRRKKTKRGFKTKKAASAREVDFLRQMEGTPDMTLNAFYDLYCKDMDKKLRNTTKLNKANMIESKILPYLGEKKLTEITPLDILSWQSAIQDERTFNGLHYRDSYLRSIGNQLSAMLNHAVRYYNLPSNPMSKVDRMGSKKTEEMKFWTKEEYRAFSPARSWTRTRPSCCSSCCTGLGFAAVKPWPSCPGTSTSSATACQSPRPTCA